MDPSYVEADMADLPLPFFERPDGSVGGSCCSTLERFARPPRAGGASEGSGGSSGLDSRTGILRFLDEPARVGGGGAGGLGGLEEAEPDESLADERVTLDDMRHCVLDDQLRRLAAGLGPRLVGVAALCR